MTKTTLPLLTPTATIAANTIMIVRRNGQTSDESFTAALLQTYVNTNPAISGGTINNNIIGGTTPAAGTFTTVTASNIVTSQVKASGVSGVVLANSSGTTVGTFGASGVDVALAGALTLGTDLAVADGGTGASDAATARTNLGIGTSGTHADAFFLQTANNLSELTATASTARTNIGLGTIATQNANNVTITGGSVTGITDITVADGGTGASTAANARTNLGLVIGTDVQAQNAALSSIAGLATAADTMIYTTASNVYATTTLTLAARNLLDDTNASTMRTTLGLGTIATQDANNVTITGGSVTGITDITVADGGTGSSTASGARTNLGLGTIAIQDANNVNISGGAITGIADLAVADGGTGASTAANARTNLGLVIGTNVQAFDANLTTLTTSTTGDIFYASTTNTIAKRAIGSTGNVLTVSGGVPTWAAPSVPTGGVLQTLSQAFTTTTAIAGTTFAATGLTQAITPSATSSKVLVTVHINIGTDTSGTLAYFKLQRGGVDVTGALGTLVGSRLQATIGNFYADSNNVSRFCSFTYLDSPASVSALTYTVVGAASSGSSIYINRTSLDADTSVSARTISTITIMEIKG